MNRSSTSIGITLIAALGLVLATGVKGEDESRSSAERWAIKAFTPDGHTLDVKAISADDKPLDVKAIPTHAHVMDVKAIGPDGNPIPIKLLPPAEAGGPYVVRAIPPDGEPLDIVALGAEGAEVPRRGLRQREHRRRHQGGRAERFTVGGEGHLTHGGGVCREGPGLPWRSRSTDRGARRRIRRTRQGAAGFGLAIRRSAGVHFRHAAV